MDFEFKFLANMTSSGLDLPEDKQKIYNQFVQILLYYAQKWIKQEKLLDYKMLEDKIKQQCKNFKDML